jgi:hypothetical protein
MSGKLVSFFKSAISVFMVVAISSFLIQGVLSDTLKAQPGVDTDFKFPVLQESDFQLFLNFLSYIEQKKDPASFFSDNNVTEEHTQVVVTKISMNAIAKIMDSKADLEKELGSSIIFTPSEETLYKKYEDRIVAGLVQFGMSEESQ